MAKTIRIERLLRCDDHSAPIGLPAKGAGIILRNSDLRFSALVDERFSERAFRRPSSLLIVIDRVRNRLEREYMILCRNGFRPFCQRIISSAARLLRSRAWCR